MILDGKSKKIEILNTIKKEVSNILEKIKLVVIQVGNDDDCNMYVNQKKKMCQYVGFDFSHIKLDDSINTNDLIELINKLNNDKSVTGIMLQLPLPRSIDTFKVINHISYLKDVDGLTSLNYGNLVQNIDSLNSCTALGIIKLLELYNISVSSKNVVIVGRSNLVGKPLAMMMLNKDATVTICHSKTEKLDEFTRNADILVVAVGIPKFIKGNMIKNQSIVIDVGINVVDNKIIGDVDIDSVKEKTKYVSLVPGGVGQMTVAMLANNILKAYKMQNDFGGKYE